jgi:hypothetical protein
MGRVKSVAEWVTHTLGLVRTRFFSVVPHVPVRADGANRSSYSV